MGDRDEAQWMRDICRMHINQGWGTIGYSYGVGQSGTVYEGCGLTVRPIHSPPRNSDAWGVVHLQPSTANGTPTAPISQAMKNASRALYVWLGQQAGRSLQMWWHGRDFATACPGADLRNWVAAGMPATGAPPAPAPPGPTAPVTVGRNITNRPTADIQRLVGVTADGIYGPQTTAAVRAWQGRNGLAADGIWGPLSDARGFPGGGGAAPSRPMIRQGARGNDVRHLQTRLNALIGAGLTVDGDFGPRTDNAVRNFQRSRGLAVDGIVGPQTWGRLG